MKLWNRKAGSSSRGQVLHCSFCRKSQRDVKKLVAGPAVYICDECIAICVDIVANNKILDPGSVPPESLIQAQSCSLCGDSTDDPIEMPRRGVLCRACLWAIQAVGDKAPK